MEGLRGGARKGVWRAFVEAGKRASDKTAWNRTRRLG
jgi:hypothetical protein